MQLKRWYILAVILILSTFVFGACAKTEPSSAPAPSTSPAPDTTSQAEIIELRVASDSNDVRSAIRDSNLWWADEIEKRTEGKVKVTLYFGQTLVKQTEALDATRLGTVDMSWMTFGLFPAELPLNTVGHGAAKFHYPYAPAAVMAYWQLFNEFPEMEAEFTAQNTKMLIPLGIGDTNLASNKEVHSLDDMKGLKVRAPGALFPKVIAAAGGVPVSLPAPEVFDALTKGIVDATTASLDAMQTFKYYEAAKYRILVKFGAAPTLALVSNLDVWNKLPADVQKVMIDIGPEFFDTWAPMSYAFEKETEELIEDAGMIPVDFPETEAEKWRNLPGYKAIMDDWINSMEAKGLPGKAVMDEWLALENEMVQTYGPDGTHWK
jgi:TRAP-type C4-dicarboxylate transport system substrate-binding protein